MNRFIVLAIWLFAMFPAAAENFLTWQKRMPITFSGFPADGETLTNFPALIIFSNTAAGVGFYYDDFLSPPWGDLRFAADDETTPLDFEVESWDTNGLSYVWVRIPELTNGLVIYALWGEAGVVAPPCTANGAAWEGGFRGTWHLVEGVEGTNHPGVYRDSTTYANHGSDYVSATGKEGVVNGGQAFDGTDDYIGAATLANSVSNDFTISFWLYPTTTHAIDSESTSGTGGTSGQRYALWPEWGDAKAGAGISAGNNGVSVYEHGAAYMPALLVWSGTLSGWTHVTVAYLAKRPRLYINGSLVRTGLTSTRGVIYPSVQLGGSSYGYFPGKIDEFRVESVTRSSNWIHACYMNMASNSVFNSYGEPEYQGAPIVTNLVAVSENEFMTLNGYLISTGMDANVSAAVFWGTNDAGRQAEGWTYTNRIPGIVAEGPLSADITPDKVGQLYYFRFSASNSFGQTWASPVHDFRWWADVRTGSVFSTW